MVRLPRNLARVAVACSFALSLGSVLPVWAQDASGKASEQATAIRDRFRGRRTMMRASDGG